MLKASDGKPASAKVQVGKHNGSLTATLQGCLEKFLDYYLAIPGKSNYIVSTKQKVLKMKTKVIRIGNSKGIRIPQQILAQSGLESEVEIEVKNKRIILKHTSKAREDWGLAFQRMSENKDDILLDKEYLENSSSWDNEEWEW